jgi:multidrug efflux pump subunit AcrA (membrane-fusion protein)
MPDTPTTENAEGTPIPHPLWLRVAWHATLFILILAAGIGTERHLARNRKPPERVSISAPNPQVHVSTAIREDVRIILTGFGTVRAGTRVEIRPQVGGRVTRVHPRLERGETIAAGEVLFQIDPRDFDLKIETTKHERVRIEAEIARIREELAATERLLTKRGASAALSQAEAERQRSLYEAEGVGTRSAAEQAERLALLDSEQLTVLSNTMQTLPHRITALEAQLAANATQQAADQLQLSRCTVTAPFDGRPDGIRVETGDVVSPGVSLITFVDDNEREITVDLDARDVNRWLRFQDGDRPGWFAAPEPVDAEIRWLGDADGPTWSGSVLRIEEVDPRDRLVTVALKVKAGQTQVPLVAGMFCEVRIPGKVEENLFRLPRSVLREDGVAFVVQGGALATRELTLVREDGETALLRGLEEGDEVVTNRLKGAVLGLEVLVRERDGQPVEPPTTTVSTEDGSQAQDLH